MPTVQTIVSFPNVKIENPEIDKFRLVLGKLIKEHSAPLYEHFDDSSASFYYPLVQYKIIGKMPFLLAYNEAAEALDKILKKIKTIDFDGAVYQITEEQIKQARLSINPTGELNRYEFKSNWLALNPKNFSLYKKLSKEERKLFLDKTLQNNIISCLKGLNYYATEKIVAKAELIPTPTQFKDQKMLGFKGVFETNAILPELIGIGRLVGHGFGAVRKL
jgi:hypothetical protein